MTLIHGGIENFRPYTHQTVDVGFVIVTEDSGAGMVYIHDHGPGVLESDDALR
jgi:putative SOS response-associated peptidase YedK